MNANKNTTILGAGPAGLAAGYRLRQNGLSCALYEQNGHTGGLCHSFQIDGFTFDTFIHLSFTQNPQVRSLFDSAGPYLSHAPESQNYWRGYWLRHPAQNNLFGLPTDEKTKIIKSFVARPELQEPENYEQWLRLQYGDYFAEHFPIQYTKKYWCCDARDMETKWIGRRLSQPGLDEVLRGALEPRTENDYYASEMRYPEKGGFASFLAPLQEGLDVRLNKQVVKIDADKREITFADGSAIGYETLISTIPLPELCAALAAPKEILAACDSLAWTQGAIVSVGLKSDNIHPFEPQNSKSAQTLWFYAYDGDIPFARCYFANRKSPGNVPAGCGAIQAECYAHNRGKLPDLEELRDKTIASFVKMGIVKERDILFADVRAKPYANVIFDHKIYKSRKTIHDYLDRLGIVYAGRFGAWDYLWSDQSVLSGLEAAGKIDIKEPE